MFPPAVKDESMPADVSIILQRMAVAFLGLMALTCAHALLYHLHYILAPFVLSGFLVLALEPTVQGIYTSLAGISAPHRWCCCCMHRRWRRRERREVQGSASERESDTSEDDMGNEERQESQALLATQAGVEWEGFATYLMDRCCRFAAVIIVMVTVGLIALFLISLLARGAFHMKDHWSAYQVGMNRVVSWFDQCRSSIVGTLKLSGSTDDRLRVIYTNALGKVQELILDLVNMIVAFVTGGLSFAAFVIMYSMFWLFQPLPIGPKAGALIHNYIWKKTLVSFLYGVSVSILLYCLNIDLPVFFGLVSFFLNYVPEVGAFISMLACAPIILLDGKLDSPGTTLFVATLGQVILKVLIGNFLELRLIQKDHEMSIHPVWVLLGLNYFGFIWGPVGMLISVPLLATMKSIVISLEEDWQPDQPFLANFASHFLACLEGRRKRSEKKRSNWMLPFAGASLTQKEKEDAAQESMASKPEQQTEVPAQPLPQGSEEQRRATSQDVGLEIDAVPKEVEEVGVSTAPKKPRQPE